MRKKKIAKIGINCVSCGTCVNTCPKDAIEINFGVIATVDENSCIGCGKCERICPAGIIDMEFRQEEITI